MYRWLLPVAAVALVTLPATAADPPKLERYDIPYRLTDTKHVLVRAKLNGQGPFNFILDTGAPAVFITKKVADAVKVKADREGWGEFTAFAVEGGLTVPKTKTRVADLFQLEGMNGMGLAGVELHGIIGYNVLAQFRITYDFAADKLVWIPLSFDPPKVMTLGESNSQGGLDMLGPAMKLIAGFMGMTPNFDVKPRGFLGIETADKDGATITAIVADSPAAKAGLAKGDKIESIGLVTKKAAKPKMIDIDGPRDLVKALAEAKAGDEAKVQVRRGEKSETITVTFGKGL